MPRYVIERKDPGDETTYSPTGETFDPQTDSEGRSVEMYLAECEARDGWVLRAVPDDGGDPVFS